MKIGVIGLGRMGAAIAERLYDSKFSVIGYDPDIQVQKSIESYGIPIAKSIEELAQKSYIIWLMIPAGKLIDTVIETMKPHLSSGHIIIDGGNSKFTDSIRRAERLALDNISFIDCGTSGGVHGKEQGFCLMVGGDKKTYELLVPLFQAVAAPQGFGHVGPAGAGHYVKMIHNGIEYGMLQAYGEGFELLREGTYKNLNLAEITNIWSHGSVIRSWLLELAQEVFEKDQRLNSISGEIEEGGTGAWTRETADKHGIKMPVLEESLRVRKESRETGGSFATKVIALLRNAFGGHAYKKKG